MAVTVSSQSSQLCFLVKRACFEVRMFTHAWTSPSQMKVEKVKTEYLRMAPPHTFDIMAPALLQSSNAETCVLPCMCIYVFPPTWIIKLAILNLRENSTRSTTVGHIGTHKRSGFLVKHLSLFFQLNKMAKVKNRLELESCLSSQERWLLFQRTQV